MAITLHDLAGRDGRRFGPTCWRVRLALAHKGLATQTVPTRFVDIGRIGDGSFKTVPTIQDGKRWLTDSDAIAAHLEEAYPEGPSLFGGPGGQALTEFVRQWVQLTIHVQLAAMVLVDIHDHLADAEDRAYFRASREARYRQPLEEVVAGRETRVEPFRKSLEPLRQALAARSYLGGATPLYADYIVLGAFQWARSISPFTSGLLTADDAVRAYLLRLLDLHDGLGLKAVGYPL